MSMIYNKIRRQGFGPPVGMRHKALQLNIFFSAKEAGIFSSIFNHKPDNVKGFLRVFLYICPFIK